MPVQTTVQMRRDTAVNWTSTNPTLASGEWGLETDTRLMKIGDGTTAWNSLGYQLGPMLDEVIATDPTGAYFTGSGFICYGVNGIFATAPDSAALDITGDIDVRAKVALTDWTPSATNVILGKWTSPNFSYTLQVNTNGTLLFAWSADGTNLNVKNSTVATGVTDGATKWIRATLDVNNGASGNDVIFYTSDDGSSWTQLGTTVTTAGVTSIFSGTAVLTLTNQGNGAAPMNGTMYRAQVLNGINGTTAFDANFETVPADSFAFTESSTNAATVTLTTTRYSFGLPQATLTGTTTGTMTANSTYYQAFSVRGKAITVKHLAFESTTAPASNSTVRLGIYSADSQLQPTGNIIYESGAITVSSAAAAIYRIRVVPFTLQPGNYVLAMNPSVQFVFRQFLGCNLATAPNTLGANLQRFYQVTASLSGSALPTTGTKWNTKNTGNTAALAFALLGW